MAISLLSVFYILPVVILALYPFAFFQKFLNLFPIRWYILHTFVDAFQGCYKDGTEQGTRDYRWFSALYISCRFFSLMVYTKGPAYFPVCSVLILLTILLLVVIQPYKSHFAFHYKMNSTFLILYAIFCVVVSHLNSDVKVGTINTSTRLYYLFLVLSAFLIFLAPLLCIMLSALFWMILRCRCCLALFRRLQLWRHQGYVAVSGGEESDSGDADRLVNPRISSCASQSPAELFFLKCRCK